ncbi:MAG: hypothetical protein N3D20_00185 [Candidatus Pacearchaeota archaeon]|nr:hypothetical protein [Candidatus Pacearchaeota archaeon]
MGKEERIKAITQLYYSNPKVLEAMMMFSIDREVIPRYFEIFGKRPDKIQYPSDILGMVKKGATSFHVSEELWNDVMALSSDLKTEELNELRKGWDLLIDVDSPFLDLSKIATKLLLNALKEHGIKNYGLKFSGNKGFHIIVSNKAFPKIYDGKETRKMFPDWARAICEYLTNYIRKDYYLEAGKILTNSEIEKNTGLKEEPNIICKKCGKKARVGDLINFKCPVCNMEISRKDVKITKRKLRCLNEKCAGFFEIINEKKYYYCEYCKERDNEKMKLNSEKNPENFEELRGVNVEKIAKLDLVLVSPRHLFRMPYSLHEKTALASITIKEEDIDKFMPRDANPLSVKIIEFMPNNEENEAKYLLSNAIEWKKTQEETNENSWKKIDENEFREVDFRKIKEEMFPESIKKLLRGLKDGRKRGLFVLITFLRALNFPADYINKRIREWNKLNDPPLKEGYIKAQIDWHLKQKKKILPPNYSNDAFYKDIGLINEIPKLKNPLSEIARKLKENKK